MYLQDFVPKRKGDFQKFIQKMGKLQYSENFLHDWHIAIGTMRNDSKAYSVQYLETNLHSPIMGHFLLLSTGGGGGGGNIRKIFALLRGGNGRGNLEILRKEGDKGMRGQRQGDGRGEPSRLTPCPPPPHGMYIFYQTLPVSICRP